MVRESAASKEGALLVEERTAPALARLAGTRQATGLQFVTFDSSVLGEALPLAIGLTYWFDPPVDGGPYTVAVRLTGKRLDVAGEPADLDAFQVVAKVDGITAASGRTSLTHRVTGRAPGRWHVRADALALPSPSSGAGAVALPSSEAVGRSTAAMVARVRAPGVVLGAWPVMVGLGGIVALVVQGFLARVHGLPGGRVLGLAAVAIVLGVVGAKTYYRVTHPREKRAPGLTGLSVQGFIMAAGATFVIGGAATGVAVGHLLDATVPALLAGQAIGRVGCLLAGCCAGVPSSSHWALWSSDRRVGTRRVPVQLLESGTAAALAVLTGLLAWKAPTSEAGLLFVGGLSAYVVARQLLFPLRGLPRVTAHGRVVSLAVASLALVASVVLAVIA